MENYLHGQKDGTQQYFTNIGDLLRQESWRAYNPEHPYDTVMVYGTASNEIIGTKIVKAEPYAVKHGEWKYYDPSGRVVRTVTWDRNHEVVPKPNPETLAATASAEPTKKKEVKKTPEMLEWEKKNKGKKRVMRDGAVSL